MAQSERKGWKNEPNTANLLITVTRRHVPASLGDGLHYLLHLPQYLVVVHMQDPIAQGLQRSVAGLIPIVDSKTMFPSSVGAQHAVPLHGFSMDDWYYILPLESLRLARFLSSTPLRGEFAFVSRITSPELDSVYGIPH